ncbi:MAG: PASTA domain-containing protein [Armatimonadota bacterium]
MTASRKRQQDNTVHPALGVLLFIWGTIKGIVSIIFTVGIFAGVVVVGVIMGLGYGPEETPVPNLVGMTVEEARAVAEERDLELKVVSNVYDSTVEKNHIIQTRPPAGRATREGQTLRAIVSKGPRNVKMPGVVGLDLERARKKVEERDLSINEIWYRSSDATREHVIQQDPEPGVLIGHQHPVTLVISGGEKYGTRYAKGHPIVFRTVRLVVPEGPALQRVEIKVFFPNSDYVHSFYNRVRRPGDVVTAELYGPKGGTLKVWIDEEIVLEKEL